MPSIPFYWEAMKTRKRIDNIWYLSAESLIIFKVLFNRGKDWVDIERILHVQEESLDKNYIRHKLLEMFENDITEERIMHWDKIIKEYESR